MNKAMIIGNLGRDPEHRMTQNGNAVANFSVATNEKYRDRQGNQRERTEWHRIVAWGTLGDNCAKYLSKGRQVFVEGRLQTRDWEDKDGNKRYTTEIVAQRVEFLGGGTQTTTDDLVKDEQVDDATPPTEEEETQTQTVGDEDVPF